MKTPIRFFFRHPTRRPRFRFFFGAYCRHASEWTPSEAQEPVRRWWQGGANGPEYRYDYPERVWGAVEEQGFVLGIARGDEVEGNSIGVEIPGRRACEFGCWAVEALIWTHRRKLGWWR